MIISKYYEIVQLIERLHRRFLDVVKVELDRRGIQDINNVQTLILFNIGEDELTVGELTLRGYYLGSNVSYNLKKMVEYGYLHQERSIHDKRSVRVSLSNQGLELYQIIKELLQKHEDAIAKTDLTAERLEDCVASLKMLERFWTTQTNFTGLESLGDWD